MKDPHSLRVSLAFVVLIVCMGSFALAQQVPCEIPARLARTNGASWRQGTITVIINPTDFPTEEQRTAIQSAFTTWQNANPNSGVTFTFTTGTQPAAGSQLNTYYVNRGTTTTGADTNIGFSGSLNTTGNITQSAVTVLDSSITRLSTITHVMLHEIGHTFGLDDCMACAQGSTIMSSYRNDCFCASYSCDQQVPFNGIRWGCPPLTQPRDCEVAAVASRAGYPTPTPTPTPEPDPCDSQVEGSGLVITNAPCTEDGGDLAESGMGECSDGIDNDQDGLIDCDEESCQRYGCSASGCSSYQQELCIALGTMGCWQGMCYTPILIDVNGDGYKMTNAANGVSFEVLPNFRLTKLSWTAENSDDAWLVLDRNGNGTIDSGEEQFGNATPQPWSMEKNGFKALAQYDYVFYGGNEDGVINGRDAVFAKLQLWCDRNHNGISERDELSDLSAAGLFGIDLNYKEWKKVDEFGNAFRYRARLLDGSGHSLGKWAFDVFVKTH